MSKETGIRQLAAIHLRDAYQAIGLAAVNAERIPNDTAGRLTLRALLDWLGTVEAEVNRMQDQLRRTLDKKPDPPRQPLFDKSDRLARLARKGKGADSGD